MVIERVGEYLDQSQFPRFTERRLAVLQAYADGVGAGTEIAEFLGRSVYTIKHHRSDSVHRVADTNETRLLAVVIVAGIKSGYLKPPDIDRDVEISDSLMRFVPGVMEGKTNRQIARDCYLAYGTVKNHIGEMMKVLGAKNRQHAAAILAAIELRNELTEENAK